MLSYTVQHIISHTEIHIFHRPNLFWT